MINDTEAVHVEASLTLRRSVILETEKYVGATYASYMYLSNQLFTKLTVYSVLLCCYLSDNDQVSFTRLEN